MGRFFRLVQNEYIKIFHNISTWIMLGVVVLAALGLNAVSLLIQNQDRMNMRNPDSAYHEGMYDSDIAYQKDSKPSGYEQEVETLEFLRDNKIGRYEWRFTAANEMMQAKSQIKTSPGLSTTEAAALNKAVQDYKDAILSNKWESYYNLKISLIDSDTTLSSEAKEVQKWHYRYSLDQKIKPDFNDWKSSLVESTSALKNDVFSQEQQQKSGQKVDLAKLDKSKNSIVVNMYRLEHNIPVDIASTGLTHYVSKIDFWTVLASSSKMISLISLLIIVIAGSCIANEFSSGTIKFLLINPVKRGKILFAKYAMVISFSYLMLFFFYLVNILVTMIFYGAANLNLPYIYVVNGTVQTISGFAYIAGKYLLASLDIVVMATLAFAISSLIRSSALAIGVGVFAMLGGNTMILFLKNLFHLDWVRYFVFANTDLSSILDGTTAFSHQTVPFALTVVAVHMVVFLLTAWDGFVRREV